MTSFDLTTEPASAGSVSLPRAAQRPFQRRGRRGAQRWRGAGRAGRCGAACPEASRSQHGRPHPSSASISVLCDLCVGQAVTSAVGRETDPLLLGLRLGTASGNSPTRASARALVIRHRDCHRQSPARSASMSSRSAASGFSRDIPNSQLVNRPQRVEGERPGLRRRSGGSGGSGTSSRGSGCTGGVGPRRAGRRRS